MPYTRIKICGITNPQDAQVVVAAGADAIGLVFYGPSPRAVSAQQAAEIVAAVSPFTTVVALFVNAGRAEIESVLAAVAIDVLQFHGDESAEFCRSFNRPYLKAVRVKTDTDVVAVSADYAGARGILLDSWQEGVPGGTGKTFDWRLAAGDLAAPMVLAGGLNADNVGTAVMQVQAAAVDVSGGVESAPGVKDSALVNKFIAAVRAADQLIDGQNNGK